MFRVAISGYIVGMDDHHFAEARRHLDAAGIDYEVVDRCPDPACIVCTVNFFADVA